MLLPYEVNAYLKTILTADNANSGSSLYNFWPGQTITFVPLNDPEPCDSSGQPLGLTYIRYFWLPNQRSMDKYFVRRDRIRYYVMSRNYDQMWKVAERLVEILNPATQTPTRIGTGSSNPKITVDEYWITGSNTTAPMEVGGLAATMLEFEFRYRLTDGTSNTGLNGTMGSSGY